MGRKIILASQSPSKRLLMEKFGFSFEVDTSDFEEKLTKEEEQKHAAMTVEEQTKHLALGKARDIASGEKDAIVIGADTITAIGEERMGKPKDEADAVRMLKKLSGNVHQSITGLAVVDCKSGEEISEAIVSDIYWRDVSDEEIKAYVATGEAFGKAGAYAILERGALFIKKIDGDPFAVSGLPVATLADMLNEMGVEYWG